MLIVRLVAKHRNRIIFSTRTKLCNYFVGFCCYTVHNYIFIIMLLIITVNSDELFLLSFTGNLHCAMPFIIRTYLITSCSLQLPLKG